MNGGGVGGLWITGTTVMSFREKQTPSRGAWSGAISGAFDGVDAIPATWRSEVEDAPLLLELADRLGDAADPASGWR